MQPVVLSTVVGKLPLVRLATSPASDEAWWYDPTQPAPASLCASVIGKTSRKRITSALLLSAQTGAWLVRRSVFEAELGVPYASVEVHDATGLVDDDWMLAHVQATVPVDRAASTFDEGQQPVLLAWATPPAVELFRLAEHPSCSAPRVPCSSASIGSARRPSSKRHRPTLFASLGTSPSGSDSFVRWRCTARRLDSRPESPGSPHDCATVEQELPHR